MSRKLTAMKLPERIKSIRLNEGISQKDMAKKLGVAVSTYQYYERGERIPPTDFVVKIITTTGVDCEWLLLGERETIQKHLGLNLDFMKEVIEAVEMVLDQERKKLTPSKKANLVILIYETILKEEAGRKGAKRGKFIKDSVSKFIRLAS